MTGTMDGIRVLEVASWTLVPMAGGVLAEWGADVIKIEHPEKPDPQRGLVSGGLFPGGSTANFGFEHPNRGKRSVGLDITTEQGHETLMKIAATCDVFLTNHLPQAREELRIDVEDLRAVNPNIIYARGTSHGERGPERNRGGFDFCTFWGRGGSADICSPPELGYPISQPGGAYGDSLGGLTIAGGIASALFRRERTGEPSIVDCSLLAMGVFATAFATTGATAYGLERWPVTAGRSATPNPLVNMYPTKDGRFIAVVMMGGDRHWPEFADAIGRPELVDDPRFANGEARTENKDACVEVLDEAFRARTYGEWVEAFADVSFVWSPVQTPGDIMRDPQVLANQYVQEVADQQGNSFKRIAVPVEFNETRPDCGRAPEHAEQTDEVLLELGLSMDELMELKIAGAVL